MALFIRLVLYLEMEGEFFVFFVVSLGFGSNPLNAHCKKCGRVMLSER